MSKSRSGAPRRIAAGLLAGALSVVGIALAPPAGAVDDVSADRVAGINRYGTAAAVAGQDDFSGATTAILATGETFPDALAASGLAGANGPAPIVLTQSDTYTDEAQEALNNLTSVTDVVIVGGTAAVSQDVEDAVAADGFAVSRLAGTDRYGTAAAIAGEFGSVGAVDGLDTALIATGTGFADALAGGPVAYALGSPILLVTPTEVPDATASALSDLGIEQVIILGGTAAVGDDVEAELESATGNDAIRVADVNRFGTAAAVGDWAVDNLGWGPSEVLLASGVNFPDALAGGPLGGERTAPIILTASLPPESQAFLDAHSDTITDITALGGTAAVDEETLSDAETAAEDTADDEPAGTAATDAPELVDLEFVNLTSTGGSAGLGQLLVRAVFDEEVQASPIVAANFKLWTAYGESQVASSAQRDSDNTSGVLVVFDIFGAGSFAAIEGTTMAVAGNTVQDADGKVNPEGEQDGFITQSFAAGSTRNADLTGVALTEGNTTNTSYDFTFDIASQVNSQIGFRMVDSDGAVRTSLTAILVSGTTPANTVVRATFAAPAGTATGIRGGVLEGTVSVSGVAALANPTQAADVTGGSGSTTSPDLVSITLDDTNDRVTFTFDENLDSLDTAGSRLGFHVYFRQAAGNLQDVASTAATDRSATDPRSVVAQFPANSINEFVAGAYSDDAAVDGDTGARPSRVDEEGVASSFEPGGYLGPELTSATVENVADVFGTVTGRRVRFLFDETITLTGGGDDFFVTDSDGNRTNLTGCALDAAPNNNRVTCTTATTTGAQFTEMGDSEVATVASAAVTGTTARATGLSATNLITNHEEAGLAPGPARDA